MRDTGDFLTTIDFGSNSELPVWIDYTIVDGNLDECSVTLTHYVYDKHGEVSDKVDYLDLWDELDGETHKRLEDECFQDNYKRRH